MASRAHQRCTRNVKGTDGRNRPGLRAVPRDRSGGVISVGAGCRRLCVAVQGEGCFPRATCGRGRGRSCRSARPMDPGSRRRQGGGAGAARSCAGQRPGPCSFARGAGQGRMGVGNERHAFAIARDLAPAASRLSPTGKAFWRPWKTFISSLRLKRRAVLCRCSSAPLPSAAGPLWGHRPVEARARCITCFAGCLSILGATSAHLCCRV